MNTKRLEPLIRATIILLAVGGSIIVALPSRGFGWHPNLGTWAVWPTLVTGNVTAIAAAALAVLLATRRRAASGSLWLAASFACASIAWGMGTADFIKAPFDQLGPWCGFVATCATFIGFTTRFPARANIDEMLQTWTPPAGDQSLLRLRWMISVTLIQPLPLFTLLALSIVAAVYLETLLSMIIYYVVGVGGVIGVMFAGMLMKERAALGFSEPNRRRVRWMVAGVSGGGMILSLTFLISIASWWVGPDTFVGQVAYQAGMGVWFLAMALAVAWIILCIAVSMFVHGAFDPELVIRKSSVTSILAVVLTALFAMLETTVSLLITTRFDLPEATGTYAAGIASALLVAPLWKLVSRQLDQH